MSLDLELWRRKNFILVPQNLENFKQWVYRLSFVYMLHEFLSVVHLCDTILLVFKIVTGG
jgi:hypothetical protein